jgi:hypothetical protein
LAVLRDTGLPFPDKKNLTVSIRAASASRSQKVSDILALGAADFDRPPGLPSVNSNTATGLVWLWFGLFRYSVGCRG